MEDREANDLVSNVFALIREAKKIEDLERIQDYDRLILKNKMDLSLYPKITFKIAPEDIEKLLEQQVLTSSNHINVKALDNLDAFTKLLYSVIWKNGDLKKIKHIIEGVLHSNSSSDSKDDGLVFYQFGKYLTKVKGQPIIDQHVIRAFAIYNENENTSINALRKQKSVGKKHKDLINQYKAWLSSEELTAELKKYDDYSYYIDKLLFALGKAVYLKK